MCIDLELEKFEIHSFETTDGGELTGEMFKLYVYIQLHVDNGGSCDTNNSSVEESTFIVTMFQMHVFN